jgi:protoheme IX farnesyltransferase
MTQSAAFDDSPQRWERVRELLRDLVTLGKPGITGMNVFMTAGAIALAPRSMTFWAMTGTLLATAACIASANALNMWMERKGDIHMARTRNRPLPAGRMSASWVLIGSLLLGGFSIAGLAYFANWLTAGIGAAALISYVWIYTPLKRRSSLALLVGAFPGAAPPLMGWTAATNQVDAIAITLFLILLLWQIPHFIAIAIYRKADYERAGIKVVTSVRGNDAAKVQALFYAALLVPVTLLLVPLGLAGYFYLVFAAGLGVWFFIFCVRGMEPESGNVWARKFFLATLLYLPVLIAALAIDVLLF